MRYLIFLALLAPMLVNAASIHKWIDADGNVHYGDTPPPNSKTQGVRVQGAPSNPGRTLPRLGDQSAAEAEPPADGASDQTETASSSSDPDKIACDNAKKDLRVINRSSRIKLRTSDGEERYLTPDEVTERKTRAQSDIDQYCN